MSNDSTSPTGSNDSSETTGSTAVPNGTATPEMGTDSLVSAAPVTPAATPVSEPTTAPTTAPASAASAQSTASATVEKVAEATSDAAASAGDAVKDAAQSVQKGGASETASNMGATAMKGASCFGAKCVKGFALAQQVIANPVGVWKDVKEKEWSVKDIYTEFLIPLSAIPAISVFIGVSIFGHGRFFSGLVWGVVHYGLNLLFVYAAALLIKALASQFGGGTTLENSLKLLTVASLPAFFASVVFVIPMRLLALIPVLAGLAGLYSFYQGIPVMTGVPDTKRLLFLCILVVATIIFISILQAV